MPCLCTRHRQLIKSNSSRVAYRWQELLCLCANWENIIACQAITLGWSERKNHKKTFSQSTFMMCWQFEPCDYISLFLPQKICTSCFTQFLLRLHWCEWFSTVKNKNKMPSNSQVFIHSLSISGILIQSRNTVDHNMPNTLIRECVQWPWAMPCH